MWSMYDFPFPKLASFWRSSLSTAAVMRLRMTRQKTLLVMDSSVMPLELSQSDRFHFSGRLINVPLLQESGITSLSLTSWSMR